MSKLQERAEDLNSRFTIAVASFPFPFFAFLLSPFHLVGKKQKKQKKNIELVGWVGGKAMAHVSERVGGAKVFGFQRFF